MNIINSTRYIVAGVAACFALAASAVPVVQTSSVSATQDNIRRTVKIEYQLTGEPGIVTIDIQTNVSEGVWASIGGEHYQNMYGAVNRINTNLTTKSYAYWQPDVDWESNDPTKVNVRAEVTAWSTNSSTPSFREAEMGTTGRPRISSISLTRTEPPLLRTSSIILSASTIGMFSSISCIVK